MDATKDFRAGEEVRLKANPARRGVFTGETTERRGLLRLEIDFGDCREFHPVLAIESVTDENSEPRALMRALRFVRGSELRSSLTHCRLSGRVADMIYSLNTTNTDFYAYQYKPVLSFIDSQVGGILIADEVGLGKTIEAGLIWTELRSRRAARRLLVLCPAILREKWQRELQTRFGVRATICTAGEVRDALADAKQSARAEFALIASLQGLRPPSGWEEAPEGIGGAAGLAQFLRDEEEERSLIDLVVIDEAHYLRNPGTQTARLGQLIRPLTENLVLLSATPIQLRSADLFNLLNLLDQDTFPYEWSFNALLRETEPLVRMRDRLLGGADLRLKEYMNDLNQALQAESLSNSQTLRTLWESPPSDAQLKLTSYRVRLANQLDRCNPISKIVNRTRKRDVQERRTVRDSVALSVEMKEVERLFYEQVTQEVRDYCSSVEATRGFVLTVPQRQMCSSMAAACREWTGSVDSLRAEVDEIIWEAFGDEAGPGEPIKPLMAELARIAKSCGDFATLRREDSKFDVLWSNLSRYWSQFPDGKVVLFAFFRGTLEYLAERIAEKGISTALLMGGMDKDSILTAFLAPAGPRILLCSEVASEGIDLQVASLVVNYDLPWNPMRIEQRIGRIDRIGQKAERILIWNVFLAETLDDRVYTRLLDRLKVFESALGTSEGILGSQIRQMADSLLRHTLSPKEEDEVIEQTHLAMQQNLVLQQSLETEASRLVAHGGYLQSRIDAARDLHRFVSSEDLYNYVRDFLENRYEGSHFAQLGEDPAECEVDIGASARADFMRFLELEGLRGRTRLGSEGAGRIRCRFENKISRSSPTCEVISQFHPLVSWVTRSIRATERHVDAPVVAVSLGAQYSNKVKPGTYVFAVQRWTFNAERTVERLVFSAKQLGGQDVLLSEEDAERLVTACAMKGRSWIDAAGLLNGNALSVAYAEVAQYLDRQFDESSRAAELESRDRIAFQIELQDRHEKGGVDRLMSLVTMQREQGKLRAAALNEGRIRSLQKRIADRRNRLSERLSGIGSECRLTVAGVAQVS